MEKPKIVFIGGGNMSAALVGGLVADHYPADKITVIDRHPEKLALLQERLGIHTLTDIETLNADVIFFAVKPQDMKQAAKRISNAIQNAPLIISIAAGITLKTLESCFNTNLPIVRCMPNTPVMVRCGASALFGNTHCSDAHKQIAESILRSVGLALWAKKEEDLNAITALSGSGPAYYFYFTEALIESGIKAGLDLETANLLARQTALGASRMIIESTEPLQTLCDRACSSKGGTQRAILSFEKDHLKTIVDNAFQAALRRYHELTSEEA